MKLAAHYNAMAAKHEAEAPEHEELAAEYTRDPQFGASKHPVAGNTAEHCKFFAEHCRATAKELRAMASGHEEMAKSATKLRAMRQRVRSSTPARSFPPPRSSTGFA